MIKEKKHRVEDALQAIRAALEEGIVPPPQASASTDTGGDEGEHTGARIVLRALEKPLCQLAENAGLEGSVVVNDVRKTKAGRGLNAATDEIVDLVAAGVIDPAMVTRSALQNAASIAKNILMTEASSPRGAGEGRRRMPGGGVPRRKAWVSLSTRRTCVRWMLACYGCFQSVADFPD